MTVHTAPLPSLSVGGGGYTISCLLQAKLERREEAERSGSAGAGRRDAAAAAAVSGCS